MANAIDYETMLGVAIEEAHPDVWHEDIGEA